MKKSRKIKRGGQPVTSWTFTPTALPGSPADLPPIRPAPLRRTDASDDYVAFGPTTVRRLDFSGETGCASVNKRLPGHRPDQCEKTDNVDETDRLMCIQPGEGQVRTVNECGPTRIGGKRRTRKTKKSKRKTRRKV